MQLPADRDRLRLLARGYVAADGARCVQCGICEHNCCHPTGREED